AVADAGPALDEVQLEAAHLVGRRRIGRAFEPGGEPLAAIDVAALRVRVELARRHVFDHSLTQRTDSVGLAHGVLHPVRFTTPRFSGRGSPLTMLSSRLHWLLEIPPASPLAPAQRAGAQRLRALIRMWLDCPVEETDDRGRKTCTTEARDKRRGIPQGSPISPSLADIYMRRFVLGWKMFGLERTLGTRLVTYADDLVILCRRGKGEEALQRLREIMDKLKLTVNEEKTRVCKVPEGEFDFLGYSVLQRHGKEFCMNV